MKFKKQIFFFLFISSLFLILGTSSGLAFDPETTTIKANWLYLQAGSFKDATPHSWENKIRFTTGGEDLSSFNNLGIIAYNNSEVLYKAEATFGFELTAHTTVGFRDVFPYINLNKEHSEMFFTIHRKYVSGIKTSEHSVKWNSVDYGSLKRYHIYEGNLPITVGIKDLAPPSGTIILNGVSFKIPEYTTRIIQVKVADARDGQVGAYNDIFTNVADVSDGKVTFDKLSDDFSAKESKIIGYYAKQELGWRAGAIQRGQTIQQSVIDTQQKGTTHHNDISVPFNTPFTFNQYINLQPEVFEYVQYNKIRYAVIKYMTWGFLAGTLDTLVGPATKNAPKRVVAIHTTNNFIHIDFTVDVEFYATIPSTAKLTQSILEDPYLKRGDMVWDTSFTGDYDVSTPLTTLEWWDMLGLPNIFGILKWIFILALVGIGGYVLYKILKKRKR